MSQGVLSFHCNFCRFYLAFNNFPFNNKNIKIKITSQDSKTLAGWAELLPISQAIPTLSKQHFRSLGCQLNYSKFNFCLPLCLSLSSEYLLLFCKKLGIPQGRSEFASLSAFSGFIPGKTECTLEAGFPFGKCLTLRFKEPSPLFTLVSLPRWVSKSLNFSHFIDAESKAQCRYIIYLRLRSPCLEKEKNPKARA